MLLQVQDCAARCGDGRLLCDKRLARAVEHGESRARRDLDVAHQRPYIFPNVSAHTHTPARARVRASRQDPAGERKREREREKEHASAVKVPLGCAYSLSRSAFASWTLLWSVRKQRSLAHDLKNIEEGDLVSSPLFELELDFLSHRVIFSAWLLYASFRGVGFFKGGAHHHHHTL